MEQNKKSDSIWVLVRLFRQGKALELQGKAGGTGHQGQSEVAELGSHCSLGCSLLADTAVAVVAVEVADEPRQPGLFSPWTR